MQKGLRDALVIPLYILGFIIIGLISGYLTFKVLSFSKTVEVPDLRGKTLVEANDILNKRALNLKVEGEDYDPIILPGHIVRQDIPPGNKVKEQRGIRVILSRGPKVRSVPEVVGNTLSEAESIIVRSGLRINKIIRVHSSAAGKDVVIAQKPTPDEAIKDTISLVVSSGPYVIIYYSPDFYGKSKDEAMAIAEKLGIKAEFTGTGSAVRSQKPKPNSFIKSGETIYLHLEGGAAQRG